MHTSQLTLGAQNFDACFSCIGKKADSTSPGRSLTMRRTASGALAGRTGKPISTAPGLKPKEMSGVISDGVNAVLPRLQSRASIRA